MLNGVVIGFFAALIGAVLWAVVVAVTHYELGIVAVGIGLLVGTAMARNAAPHPALPVIAAALALLGCLLGDVLCDVAMLANGDGLTLLDAFRITFGSVDDLVEIFKLGFSPMSLLFWAIAALYAVRAVRRAALVHQVEEQQAANAQLATQLGSPYAQPAAPEAAPAAEPKPEADPV
jgi:hypothetical protein